MRLGALSLATLALTIIMISSASAHVAAIQPAAARGLETKARALIEVAIKAEARVSALIEMVLGNETIMKAIEDAGLSGSLNEALSLRDQGSALLEEARGLLEAGNYIEAAGKAIEAMRLFKEAYTEIHKILCKAGVTPLKPEEAPELRAWGLLIAANRSLERIKCIRSLPNVTEVEDLLSRAESLLNEVRSLIEQGEVSEAAHKLAEANRLISEAFARLKRRAEEMVQKRAEKFVQDFGRVRSEIAKRVREEGLNETEVLESLNLGNLTQIIDLFIKRIRETLPTKVKEVIKEAIEDLRGIGRVLRETKEIIPGEPSVRASIGEILANATAFKGGIVRVEGIYCGRKPPENLPGPAAEPPKAGWWILADETGWIYVVGVSPVCILRGPPLVEGAKVTVIGRVVVEDGTVYIRAMVIIPGKYVIKPIPPSPPVDILRLNVEAKRLGRVYLIEVTIENIGDETIVFPNSAYGIEIQRKVAGQWVRFYAPISLQVLTPLQPGERSTVTIQIERPALTLPPGVYRVMAEGWLEKSGLRVSASAEFTLS